MLRRVGRAGKKRISKRQCEVQRHTQQEGIGWRADTTTLLRARGSGVNVRVSLDTTRPFHAIKEYLIEDHTCNHKPTADNLLPASTF